MSAHILQHEQQLPGPAGTRHGGAQPGRVQRLGLAVRRALADLGLPGASRALVLAALLLRLVIWQLWPDHEALATLVPLIMSCGAATAGMAVLSGQWAEPDRSPLWLSLVLLGLCLAVVIATGGVRSWYISALVVIAVLEAAFHPPRQAWLLSGAATGCLAAPLFLQWDPWYIPVLAVATAVVTGMTWWVTRYKQDKMAAVRLAASAQSGGLTASLDLAETLQNTVDLARELLEPTACVLYMLCDDDGRVLRASYVYLDQLRYGAEEREALLRFTVPYGTGLIGHVAASGRGLLVSDVTADSRTMPIPGKEFRPQSAIVVPLQYGGQMLGAMRVSRDGVALYDGTDLAVAQVLANQAAIAIANARLYEATRRAQAVATESEQRYERLTGHAGEVVLVWDSASERLSYVSRAAESLLGYSLEDYEREPDLLVKHVGREGLEALRRGAAQLESGAEVVKDLVTEWRSREGWEIIIEHTLLPVRDELGGIRAVESLCRDITEQRRMENEIRHLAHFDQLTGVHNRLYFEQRLQELAGRPGTPVSIILGDLNGLKLVNDAFGHQAGDDLLRRAAEFIGRSVRADDTVCRWGGDEFAIIISRGGAHQAGLILDRLRAAMAAEGAQPIPLSIAFGTAHCDDASAADLRSLLREAEDRMYRTKLLEARSNHSTIIGSLQKTLHEKTHETAEHAARLQELCRMLAGALGLSEDAQTDLSLLALLHDIGKVGIPDHVLANTGELSPAEWQIMQRHPEIGYRIAASTPNLAQLADYILAHHEHWDGGGYPRGLRGAEIPLVSRILAIADAYDTMTSGRPYREAISSGQALVELARCAGKQFDPHLVRLFRHAVLAQAGASTLPEAHAAGAGYTA